MTGSAALGARRCKGCRRLLHARDRCACDTELVHVVITLGPTPNMPGQRVRAQLAGNGPGFGDIPVWRYDPWGGIPAEHVQRVTQQMSDRVDETVEEAIRQATRDQAAVDRLAETLRRHT